MQFTRPRCRRKAVSSLCIQRCHRWSRQEQQRQSPPARPAVRWCSLLKPALLSGTQDVAPTVRDPTLPAEQPAEEQVSPSFLEHSLCALVWGQGSPGGATESPGLPGAAAPASQRKPQMSPEGDEARIQRLVYFLA